MHKLSEIDRLPATQALKAAPSPSVLAKAEVVDPEELELRGCPHDLSGETRATWDCSFAPWPVGVDSWPGDLVDNRGRHPIFILLHGPVGCGKSHIAAWIMRRALASKRYSWWIDVPHAMQLTIEAIRDQRDSPVWSWIKKSFCVFDDIGAHRTDSEFQEDLLLSWISERYRARRFTVITTNLKPNELRDVHPRSASRMLSGPVVAMTGKDARRKQWAIAQPEAR
jgi:hypothetical protein